MTSWMFAWYVTCLLWGRMGDMTALNLTSSLRFVSVDHREDVTLECFYEDNAAVMFYWYKQSPGQKPQLVSKFYKHDKSGTLIGEFKNDPRFKLETSAGNNHLTILYAQFSDSATYYCIGGYSHVYEFMESIIIHIKDPDLNVQTLVHQSESESIQPGGSVTLNCTVHTGTCDGGHSVYWFKQSEESHPGLIYTHGDSNDQCERKPNTYTHTCVYNLPMKDLSVSHAGTYYCAVASCGHILFGNGTKLDIEDDGDSPVLVYFLSGAVAFTTILAIFLTHTAYTLYRAKRCQGTDCQERSSAASAPKGNQDADDLHYAAVRTRKANRPKRQRDDTSVCVYSSVRP